MRFSRRFSFSLFKRAGKARRLVLTGLAGVIVCGAISGVALAATADPPSTYGGVHLTIAQAAQYGYNAGFHTEDQLVAVVSIGLAESSLWTGTRNWHPEYGYRPASDVIGVQGPAEVWNSTHTQQIHSDRGPWQISSRSWPQYTDAQTDDPAQAAAAMWSISSHGTNWMLWDTYKNGAAQQFFTQVRPVVQQFLGSSPTTAPTTTPTTVKPTTTTVKPGTTTTVDPGTTTTTVKPVTTTTVVPPPTTTTTTIVPVVPNPDNRRVTVDATIKAVYAAGIHTENQLVAITAIGMANSGLSLYARHWHPEQGYRPASDVIGVRGPSEVWSADGKRQLHSNRGIWQVSSKWWAQYSDARTDDLARAAVVVFDMTGAGSNLSMFDSYKSGAAQKFYDAPYKGFPAVRPLVQRYLHNIAAAAGRK